MAGDALALPFADAPFDAVTISFGLRNVADPGAALAELLRVTRPGGRLVVCEFSHLPAPAAGPRCTSGTCTPALPGHRAAAVARTPGAYDYLAESITDWPGQRELAAPDRRGGLDGGRAGGTCSLGIVAVHQARRGRARAAGPHRNPAGASSTAMRHGTV